MEKDPLRWHGGIKVSMAVAFNEGMDGVAQEMPKVRCFRQGILRELQATNRSFLSKHNIFFTIPTDD